MRGDISSPKDFAFTHGVVRIHWLRGGGISILDIPFGDHFGMMKQQ
jgi:hypothetical protein